MGDFRKIAIATFISLTLFNSAKANQDEAGFGIEKYETKEAALKAAGLDIYDSEINRETIFNANKNEPQLSKNLGDKYAGTWIEYDENNHAYQVIATTSPVNIDQSLLTKGKTVFTLAKHGYKKLIATQEKMAELLLDKNTIPDNKLVFSLDIDIPSNIIIINAQQENFKNISDLLAENGFDLSMIDLRTQEISDTLTGDLWGGTRVVYGPPNLPPGPITYPTCTAGFNAFADDIYPVVITAGHCAKDPANNNVYMNSAVDSNYSRVGDYIGEYLAIDYYNGVDAALFGNTALHTTHSRISLSASTAVDVNAPIAITPALVNTQVCGFGGRSGWKCAKLSSINNIRTRPGVGAQFRLAIVDFCSLKGDSGGPVISATNNAIGMLSATENSNGDNCASIGGTLRTSFQPLTDYLARYPNVKLLLNKP
ncbi:MAG: S1 family peptidase [Pseudomonadales bacterium]